LIEHPWEDVFIKVLLLYFPRDPKSVIDQVYFSAYAQLDGEGGRQPAYDSAALGELVRAYSLASLLDSYGDPDQVLLRATIADDRPGAYDLITSWVLYPSRGAIVQHEMKARRVNNTLEGCPSAAFLKVWLVPPFQPSVFLETLSEATDPDLLWRDLTPASPRFKVVEDAVGMTLDEFSSFHRSHPQRCLQTPLPIWPPP
jgi:hypothetical protein